MRNPFLKGLCRVTQRENQCKNVRLKSTWIIGEGDPLTHLEAPERQKPTGMLPQGLMAGQRHFGILSLNC